MENVTKEQLDKVQKQINAKIKELGGDKVLSQQEVDKIGAELEELIFKQAEMVSNYIPIQIKSNANGNRK